MTRWSSRGRRGRLLVRPGRVNIKISSLRLNGNVCGRGLPGPLLAGWDERNSQIPIYFVGSRLVSFHTRDLKSGH